MQGWSRRVRGFGSHSNEILGKVSLYYSYAIGDQDVVEDNQALLLARPCGGSQVRVRYNYDL